MDSFIFNDYTKRIMNGEVNSAQVWNFLPVNKKFVETFESMSSLNFNQFRTSSDIGCYSSENLTEPRNKYLQNYYKNEDRYSFEDMVDCFSGRVSADYSVVRYKKETTVENKPMYIDNSVSDDELYENYGIELNETHKKYQNDGGFYYVTKVSELNWLSKRCERNNEFNVCLGDNIVGETIINSIGTYEHPYQGTFDGAGYVISSCIIDVNSDINGVIGVLGNNGVVKNVKIEDMSFTGNNLLTTSYINEYASDINVGFVAKNYGSVYDVSSIGKNYFYGLSPTHYSIYNKSDDKGELDTTYNTGYYIHNSAYRFIKSGDSYFYFDRNGNEPKEVTAIYLNIGGETDSGNPVYTKIEEPFLMYTQGSQGNYFNLYDWHKDDNGNFRVKILNGFPAQKIDNFIDIEKSDRITTFDDSGYKNSKYYYNTDNMTMVLKRATINNYEYVGWTGSKEYKRLYISADSLDYYDYEGKPYYVDYIYKNGNNYYQNKNNDNSLYDRFCSDDKNNINSYLGYYNCGNFDFEESKSKTETICEGQPTNIKYTYLVSPIVGSNFNFISGCLNNSELYFGFGLNFLEKESYGDVSSYNPFAGEFGGIACYSEGVVLNNSSNSVIKNYYGDVGSEYKFFIYCTEDETEILDDKILDSMYKKQYETKNCLIYGNIIGRNNMYSNSSKVVGNESKLIIENTDKFDKDYFRPSTLVGSVYMNTCLNSVSSYESVVSGNISKIENNDDTSATQNFNEIFMCLDSQYPNSVHYSDKKSKWNGGFYVYQETSASYINQQKNEINELSKKFKDNDIEGKYYNNLTVNIPNSSYISNYYSYIDSDNHLKNVSYGILKGEEVTLNHEKMSYELEGDYQYDKFFDVETVMLKRDYLTNVVLNPLSANVVFDYSSAKFMLVDSENDLCWGTSGNPYEILKTSEPYTGNIINTKDFAGVIIYDNSGNLIGYDNNYKTNVLYNTYSMKFVDDVIMEFK